MRSFSLLLILIVIFCGCKKGPSKKEKLARLQGMAVGRQQAAAMPPVRPTVLSVSVIGMVRNKTVKWQEGLTLSQAIVAADYYDLRDPTAIYLTREGAATYINPKDLLKGQADYELLPSDIIDIRR